MKTESPAKPAGFHAPSDACLVPQDMDMVMRTMKGIADADAGRCAPVTEVRARVLARYEPVRACV